MTRRWLLLAFGALGAACGDTTQTGVTELNLDRPVDVSFACYGKMRQTNGHTGDGVSSDPIITTAMPTAVCDALSPSTPAVDLATGAPIAPTPLVGQEPLPNASDNPAPAWYAFILQSASGTVALATWPAKPADSIANPAATLSDFSVLDADPLTPGKNAISIGEDPVAIATDKTGCFEVTANAGSCDLSELNITSALNIVVGGSASRLAVDRVPITLPPAQPGGNPIPLLSRPAAMIVEPGLDPRVPPGTQVVGNVCPGTATGQVYIAYPSCHLVAEVQLGADATGKVATAQVIGGIHFDDTTGAPSVLDAAGLAALASSCPTECTPPKGIASVPVPPGGVRPVALDYKLDPRVDTGISARKTVVTSRLAIGADISATSTAAPLAIVDLDLTTFAPVATSLRSIPLEADRGPVGVTALALSPQIGMGGNAQATNSGFPGSPLVPVDDQTADQAQYIYAVATDGTVRVADVLTLNRECDTQIDGRFLREDAQLPELGCLQSGQANRPRRSGVRSPGIELPDGEVAISVAIIKGRTLPLVTIDPTTTKAIGIQPAAPGTLVGYFAVIAGSSGTVYMANIDDDDVPDERFPNQPISTSPVLVMAHQLRDTFTGRDDLAVNADNTVRCTAPDPPLGGFDGGPRLGTPPAQQTTANTLRADLNPELPRLQQVACEFDDTIPLTALEFGAPQTGMASPVAPPVSRDTVFPDLKSLVNLENWTLTYEGTLGSDATVNHINGPQIRTGQAFVNGNGMFFDDPARPFCDMGIEPGDIVELRGCNPSNGDADCPADYTCYVHPLSNVSIGACFLKSEAPRLADACQDFLSSIRRYTVGTDPGGHTEASKLVLLERKHELSTTPVDGCVSDEQCDDLAHAALVLNQSADPFIDVPAGTPAQTKWSCRADPLRKPINPDPARNKRCMQICTYTPRTKDNKNSNAQAPFCASGTVCLPDGDPTMPGPGVCMEGVEPPQACLNGPQRYDVHAGEAFAVVGDRSGFVHPIVADANGVCQVDPNLAKDPLTRGRIPLTAPPCDPGANVFTGLDPVTNTFEANPCSLTVTQFEYEQDYPQLPPAQDGSPAPYGLCTGPTIPLDDMSKKKTTTRMVPAIKFRNRAMTLTLVDPYREAADSCLKRDPAGIPTNVPLVVPGYGITLSVKGGFLPPFRLSLLGQVSPVKVVRGPSESMWVIDDGDFLATSIVQASTRGRVFRVESSDTTLVNIME